MLFALHLKVDNKCHAQPLVHGGQTRHSRVRVQTQSSPQTYYNRKLDRSFHSPSARDTDFPRIPPTVKSVGMFECLGLGRQRQAIGRRETSGPAGVGERRRDPLFFLKGVRSLQPNIAT